MAETEILEGSAVPARPARRRRSRSGRVLRVTGLVFIAAALVLLGYMWWNLWGTGFATQRAQDDVADMRRCGSARTRSMHAECAGQGD